jgi:EmrB/QacA subfamily drug resistance transporter
VTAARGAEADRVPWTAARAAVTGGLMLSMFVAAMDSTVVGTALPTIAGQLGHFQLYPWIFAGYLITGTTSVPIWGRLADLHGRKPVLMAGLGIFVGSSILCGFAWNMESLILFRVLQGIGAGCIQPITLTVVGDFFPLRQRARIQGLFSAVWAVAAVAGPLLGALFVSTIGWRWIFDINVPIGIVSTLLLWGFKEQRGEALGGHIDYLGAGLLTAGIALLLWGLGSGNAGGQPVWLAVALAVLILAAFAAVESRSPSPTVPLALLRHPVIGPAILASMLAGTLMFGVTAYAPLFVQGGLGGTAFQAGAAAAPMSLGWPLGSIFAGRTLLRFGFERLAVAGSLALVAGSALLAAMAGHGLPWVAGSSFVTGLGMGLLSTPLLIVIQSSVGWAQRASATALNQFSRTIGGAVGVSLMGALLAARAGPGAASALRHSAAGGQLLERGLSAVFWVLVGLAIATLLASFGILYLERTRRLNTEAASGAAATVSGR